MMVILYMICALGLALAVAGLRGRVVGDDPHCRVCGFNLRGRNPSSSRCPECGTELTESAIRYGLRRRRPVLLSIGFVLLAIGSASVGVTWWAAARNYDWTPWKPTAWLVNDLDSSDPRLKSAAKRELLRRIGDLSFGQPKVDALVDRVLNRQADRKRKWDPVWGDLIDAAGQANRLGADRYERYLKQGTTAVLTIKPKVRRGGTMCVRLDIAFDRLGSKTKMRGKYSTAPLLLGSATISERVAYLPNELIALPFFSYPELKEEALATLPDGSHSMTSALRMVASVAKPFAGAKIMWDLPLSAPVQLYPSDATIDEFYVDPGKRSAMRDGIKAVRVTNDNDSVHTPVRIQFGALPYAFACEAVIVQEGDEQWLGTALLEPSEPICWKGVSSYRNPKFRGLVNVELRPAQRAADEEMTVRTYWGEPIIIRDVLVDAPYAVAFNNDPSLRVEVEKAVSATITRPNPEYLIVRTHVNRAPVKLSYELYLRVPGGRETRVTNDTVEAQLDQFDATTLKNPDPSAETFVVIFRPDADWETSSSDLIPPWGGEVVLRNVVVTSPKP